ncbi:SAE2 domain-containing protein [Mycena indigotica]|uniref:SAE2 domain-containing protein n=1 Tax=Mycena indigotica TaxID=2126181 RepID=A0A8H6WKF7_9AGAR|nr:SAE2 domain-containing protein [Mycena indigotica]KAF7315684.1 SAE2 domain-containing protein [Mycena indigotica]
MNDAADVCRILDAKLEASLRDSLTLANFLGFQTVDAAICFVPNRPTYQQLLDRTRALEAENTRMVEEKEALAARITAQTEAHSTIPRATHSAVVKELQALTRRYDELLAVKQKSDERYANDQRKFHALALYMKSPEYRNMEDEYRANYHSLTPQERAQRRVAKDVLLETKLAEIGLEIPPNFSQTSQDDKPDQNKENQPTPTRTPQRSTLKHRSQSLPRPAAVLENSSAANRSYFATDNYGTILVPDSSDVERSPLANTSPLKHLEIPTADVSQTESDYSQDLFPKIKPIVRKDDNSVEIIESSKARPKSVSKSRPHSRVQHSPGGNASAEEQPGERPRKIRRVSSPGPSDRSKRQDSTSHPGSSAATPLYVSNGDTPTSQRTDSHIVTTKKPVSKADKRVHSPGQPEFHTPVPKAQAGSSKQSIDYSVYKGRGRYANSANQTINAKFAIDATRNRGMDFEYDDVVRGREQRRQLHAEDCECCRGYYEGVGSMPNRLQPPLWRSPPKEAAPTREEQVAAHKQSISRHRHNWTRGNTPPDYWEIGFPNTQQVNAINEKAQKMQQEKEKMVEQEANKANGRYYRKG